MVLIKSATFPRQKLLKRKELNSALDNLKITLINLAKLLPSQILLKRKELNSALDNLKIALIK